MRTLLLAVALAVAGCSPPADQGPPTTWYIKLVQPDGKVQREFRVVSRSSPWVSPMDSGHTRLFDGDRWNCIAVAPTGWYWDISTSAEEPAP